MPFQVIVDLLRVGWGYVEREAIQPFELQVR